MNTRFDFSDYIQERTQNFTGREWALDKINIWLMTRASRAAS